MEGVSPMGGRSCCRETLAPLLAKAPEHPPVAKDSGVLSSRITELFLLQQVQGAVWKLSEEKAELTSTEYLSFYPNLPGVQLSYDSAASFPRPHHLLSLRFC